MAEEKKLDLFGTSSASSGGSAPATNYTPKPDTSSGNSASGKAVGKAYTGNAGNKSAAAGTYKNTKYSGKVNYSKAASNARAAVNNAKGKAGGAYATRRNYTSFGSGIDNSGRPLTGQFSQQGTPGAARVYAGGGLNPSAWGSSVTSPSVTRDSELQKAIDNLTLSTDYADRNIHAIDPLEGEDEEHAAAREAWNMGRQMWAFNDTAGVFSREYASSEEQLADILDLMTHAQVYYKDALDNNYTFNIDGKEVSAADSWKDLYDRLDRYQGWLTDIGQVQDLFARASMGESISTENIDTMKARAQARADNPYGEDDAAMWAEIISGLDGLWNGANRADAKKLQAQLDELQTQLDQSATDMAAASSSLVWLDSPDVVSSDEDRARTEARAAEAEEKRAKLFAARQAVQDQFDQLNAVYRERNMTPRIEEAMAALSLNSFKRDKYYRDKALEELTRLDEEGRVTNAAVSSRAHEMEQQDQALLDEWNTGLGFNPQFYNNWDRFSAGLAGAFLQAGSGVVSAVNWVAKSGAGSAVAEAAKTRIGYDSGRSVFEQPREPVVINSVEEGTALAESLRTQIADLDAQKHALTHEGRAPVKGQKQFHSRTLAESRDRTKNIAELDRQLRELHEQLGEVEFQMKQMSGEPTNVFEKLKYLSAEELTAGVDEFVDTLDSKRAALIAQAKEGIGDIGKLLIDVEVNGFQMFGDQLFGPASLAMLGTRVFGNKAAELRREGYGTWKQGTGAVTDAAIEIISESIFNVFGMYGGHGVTREFSERLVREWAETNVGRTLMRVALATVGEQGEEWVAWHFAPLVDIVLGEGDWAALSPFKPRSESDYKELANSVLVAGILAMGMSSVNIKGHKEANVALLKADAAELGERSEQYERDIEDATSEMTPFTAAQQSNLDRVRALQSRIENTVKGRRTLNEKGQVINPEAQRLEGARAVKKGKNRHDTATGVLAEGFEGEGYVNATGSDEAYDAATTGAEVRAPSTSAEALESEEAPEERAPDRTGEEELELEDERNQEEQEAEEWEEQERVRALEEEGARRAVQAYLDEQDAQLRAAQEAEKYAQLAHNAREFETEQEYLRKAQQAKQAAEEAAKKAEEQQAMAASQSEALEGQEAPVVPAPANQDEANQQLADSQTAALKGQEVNPQAAPAPQAPTQATDDQVVMAQSQATALEGQDTSPVVAAQSVNPATAPETALGAQATVTQANTQGETGEAVKPSGNAQGAVSTPVATVEQGRASIESGETNNKTVAQVIPMVDKYVSTGNVISHVPENPFKANGKQATLPLSKKVIQWMKNRFPTGVRANSLGGTPVVISERGIKNDVAHGVGEAKAATFAAVPDVIQNGVVVSRSDGSVKGVSVTIAGRVDLAGTPVNVYCVLKQADDGSKRFYLHEVSDGNGTVYYQLGNNKNATPALQDSSRTNPASADVTSTTSIAQNPQAGNSTNTSTNTQADGTITDEQRRQLDQFPKDISNEEAKQYAEAASTEWPVYVELRNGDAFQYDGKQLWVSDEDGLVSNPREMSHDEFARNLAEWADSERYSYITFENSPIKVKGGTDNANVQGTSDDRGNGAAGQVGRTEPTIRSLLRRSGEVSRTLAERQAKRIKDEALRDSYLNKVADRYIEQGTKFIPEEEYTPFMQQITEIAREAGVEHVAFWWTPKTSHITAGTYTPEVNALDLVFINNDSSQAKMTLKHELTHNAVDKQQISDLEDFRQIFEDAFSFVDNAEKARRQLDYAYNLVKRWYAYGIAEELRVKYPTAKQWRSLSKEAQDAAISALPANVAEKLDRKIHEEFICEAIAGRTSWFFLDPDLMVPWQNNIRTYFANKGYFSNELHGRIDALEIEFAQGDDATSPRNFETLDTAVKEGELEAAQQEQGQQEQGQQEQAPAEEAQPEELQTGRTPGRVKQSQDVNRTRTATKGETKAQFENNGETDYISRTNAQRSQTADLLTDTQEKADAQVQRLLKEDYTWTDDDVVIAQKVMFDMVKGIRDYQLHRDRKMSKEAFKIMTNQYNQLRDKHTRTLSEMGQTLQANYMFSTGDKIVMKAAQTFLGFTKDGRFAGGAVNAKNAKIYAGVEEAARRIQAAVDKGNTQSLVKICKDISDIRNVKKMFGPLSGFAGEVEDRVLARIAKGENAAQNLEALAYGNLNAVCDDVQPYKALNAAKTIRIMNMLSNSATIVNNLANNFMQGTVSRSTVGQAFTRMAAAPFENLTGQQVISKAKTGAGARKAIHNAKVEAFETSCLMQMYGIKEANGRLELDDRGMFNPNINPFEQTMSLYRFLTGVGVESTDRMQGAGFLKSMELGIDEDIKAGKIAPHTREQRMQEARHEVNKLLYKDDNAITAWVLHTRDVLNKIHVGNERVGTIGLGDITMAFAKIPTNVIKFRLMMTPEGALFQVAQYAKGVNKAKRMHAEVLAKGIVEQNQEKINAWNDALQAAYEMEHGPAKDAAIRKAQSELSKLNAKMWAEAQEACRGSVYKNLETIRNNYNENLMFDEAVERAGYMDAAEMSQFEAAQLSRKIGWAAMSVGMMALGSVLRALGALRDFDQEPNDELRKMNADKGYKGLMLNLSAMFRKDHEWKDGEDITLSGEFLEVIALPLTIGATAAEAAATAQDAKTWRWFKSMAGNGIAKTFEAVGDIPGMADAINMYESMTSAYNNDYDEKVSRLGAGLLQYAANTAPTFFMPNAVTQAVAGIDNKVRDPYAADTPWGQAKNIFMNKFPVLRNKVPVSVDVWGNERTYGEGLWGAVNKMLLPGDVLVYRKNKYETEIERLVREGYGNATPKTTVNSSFEVGDEKYTMTAQEKLDFKAARNSRQRELFETFIDSEYYKQLNDAERTKVFQALKTSAERDAKQDMLNDRQLNVDITRDKWETELLDVNDQIQFLAAKQTANNVLDRDAEDMDYAAVDEYLTGAYKALDEGQRELLDSTYSRLDDMFEAKNSYGISSEMFNTGYDIYKDYMSDEGRARVQGGYKDWEGSQMYTDIAKATGANEKQMDFFERKFVLYNNNAVTPEKYNTFVDAGWGRDTAQTMVKAVADLTPTNGRKTVSYKQRLTAIATTAGLTEAQRWEAFYEYCPSSYTSVIKVMDRYKSNGFSYEKALKAAKKWDP